MGVYFGVDFSQEDKMLLFSAFPTFPVSPESCKGRVWDAEPYDTSKCKDVSALCP